MIIALTDDLFLAITIEIGHEEWHPTLFILVHILELMEDIALCIPPVSGNMSLNQDFI